MKKTPVRRTARPSANDLRREYRFDYGRSRENRFARVLRFGSVAVVLDPDVASVFRSSESVNALLRSVISALPSKSGSKSQANKKAV